MDAVCDIFKDTLLVNVLVKDTVKNEDFLASSRVYSQARGRSDVTQGIAKSLRNEFVARISMLECRTHTDGCIRGWLVRSMHIGPWGGGGHLPTLTAVLLSSSDALLSPGLLLILIRLELRLERNMALMGRVTPLAGEPGGEVAI